MDNMEGQYSHENPLQLMSFAFGGTASDASQSYHHDPNYKYAMAAGRNQIPPVCIPPSQWIHCQETSPGSVEHIMERSVTEISRDMSYHNAIVPFGFKHTESSVGMDVGKVGGSAVFQEVKYARPQNEGSMKSFTDAEYQLHAQGRKSYELRSRALVAAPTVLSKPLNRASRRRATVSGADQGNRASQLDDIIDHTKYLQLQIKDLSRSRLGGEPTTDPFVFLEGYGHYILHEQMLNEPL